MEENTENSYSRVIFKDNGKLIRRQEYPRDSQFIEI